MPLFNFEILKPKTTVQLDIPSNYTFSQLSDIVFRHFNIDKTNYPNDKSLRLVFIHKCISCRYERTIESYHIESQSKIYICIPKLLSQIFSTASKTQVKTKVKLGTMTKPSNSSNSNLINNSMNPLTPNFSQQSNNGFYNQIPQPATNSYHSMVLNYVNKELLKRLLSYGYNEIDSAYSLAYASTLEGSLSFLNTGLSTDPQVKSLIEKYVSLVIANNTDEALQYKLEVVKIESMKKGENVDINQAANIGVYAYRPGLKNVHTIEKLQSYLIQVKSKYPIEISQKLHQMFQELENTDKITNIYNISNSTQGQNQLENQFQAYLQNMGLYQGQLQGQYQGQLNENLQKMMMNNLAVQQVRNKFFKILGSLPSMTPENFVNPFKETMPYTHSLQHAETDNFFYEYGSQLNYEQLMFLYRMYYEKRVDLNLSMQYLHASNGNIKDAEALINGN